MKERKQIRSISFILIRRGKVKTKCKQLKRENQSPSPYEGEGNRVRSGMTKHYNITPLKVTRRKLRQDQTFLEEVLWAQLRDRKCLGIKFRRQYSIDKFVIDFYSPEIKLAIELDGG
ncbi:MAG: DUF559 domain-containing protein, partial [Ignavibacteria bacterium]|nr:DUF559 domain-containing protein [Ignavibacteria bacterium]